LRTTRSEDVQIISSISTASLRPYIDFAIASQIRNNPDVVAVAVKQHGDALVFASDECRANRDLVQIAVASCGLALEDTSVELRDDVDVVLAAVRNHGNALRFASATLRRDPEVVAAAVHSHGPSLRWAAPQWRQDRAMVIAAVAHAGCALQEASLDLRADASVVLVAVANDGLALRWASVALKQSHEVVLLACSQNGDALACAEVTLRSDWHIVAAAVAQAGMPALAWASGALRGCADDNNENDDDDDDDDGVVEEDEVGGSIVPLISGSAGRRRSFHGKIGRGGGTFVSVCQEKLLAARGWFEAFLLGTLTRAQPQPQPRSIRAQLLHDDKNQACKRPCPVEQPTSPPSFPVTRQQDDLPQSPLHTRPRLESTGRLHFSSNHCNSRLAVSFASGCTESSNGKLAIERQCPLMKLGALDPETGTALKKLIADFAGIPLGRTLKHLRLARERLAEAGAL